MCAYSIKAGDLTQRKAGIGRFASGRWRSAGFTLIELMIAVVVASVLTALALSSYRNSVIKSNRQVATAALLDLASREEKYLSLTNTYTSTFSSLYPGSTFTTLSVPTSGTPIYSITISTPVAATATSSASVSFTATPISGTIQAKDSLCNAFTLNSIGQQSVSGTGTVAQCW